MVELKEPIALALTGASGAQYGLRLLELLVAADHQVYLMISKAAQMVIATETQVELPSHGNKLEAALTQRYQAVDGQIRVFAKEEWTAPVASGSNAPRGMVICPCSTGTLSAVARGGCDNLIERAADVMLKERRQLILVPREAPYSTIHLQNMLTLSQMGAVILPASPGFYHQPQTVEDLVDFVVARILDQLGIEQKLVPRWGQ